MDCSYIHLVDDKIGLDAYFVTRKEVKSPIEKSNDKWFECVGCNEIKILPYSYIKEHCVYTFGI